jgi:prepilin signal peptidase PulO-like enzyme (type II secretory pathway)
MNFSPSFYLYTGASIAIIVTFVLRYLPQLKEEYGHLYFSWPENKKMKSSYKHIVAVVLSICMLALAYRSNVHLLPGLALIMAALGGVFVLDKEFQVIPDRLHIIGSAGVVWLWIAAGLHGHDLRIVDKLIYGPGLALVLYGAALLYEKIRKTSAMGLGDIKLFAWLGLAFGSDIVAIIFLSMIGALIWNLPKLFLKKIESTQGFAFGPFIVAATFVFLLM